MNETGKVRVAVVAVDPLRSLGLQTILQDALGMQCLELTLEQSARDDELGVLLLDGMTDEDECLEVVSRLRRQRPELKVIVVGPVQDADQVQALIGAGAKGFLPVTVAESELRMALDVVMDGSIWAPRKVLARVIEAAGEADDAHSGKAAEKLSDLVTPRESEVLQLLTEGHSNREIAQALNIDEVTVKAHLGRMLRKAGASNRVELTLRALAERGSGFHPKKRT